MPNSLENTILPHIKDLTIWHHNDIIINTSVYTSLVLMSICIIPPFVHSKIHWQKFLSPLLGSCMISNADKLTDRHTNLHWEEYGRTGRQSGACVDVNFLWQLPCVTCQCLLLLVDLLWDVTHRWVLNRQKFSWPKSEVDAIP